MATTASEDRTDIELIGVEMQTLWDIDGNGRIPSAHHLVVGAVGDRRVAVIGEHVPAALAEELERLVMSDDAHCPAGQRPASVVRCQELLENQFGDVSVSSGPSYLIPAEVEFASTAEVLRSDATDVSAVRDANPGIWDESEWDMLLGRRHGPWAMALRQGRVIAMCHTPARSAVGAEAGVWTHPDVRGQGHAAFVTAQWAQLMAATGRRVFYSTSAGNRSSQSVAARLSLRPIGWLWKLSQPGQEDFHSGLR